MRVQLSSVMPNLQIKEDIGSFEQSEIHFSKMIMN